jgi:hypothetical protein
VVFFASALRSLAAEGGERWARRLFVTSLFYLPLLMAALVLSHRKMFGGILSTGKGFCSIHQRVGLYQC